MSQSKYDRELIKRFGFKDYKNIKTLMSPSTHLDKDSFCKPIDHKKYQGLIGFLLYLTIRRPDIMFSVYRFI